MKKVSIIDYGLCNLYNVSNALEHVGATVDIIDNPNSIKESTHLILPGVGAFKNGMRGLSLRKLIDPIKEHINLQKPFLGICLGMQMMLSKSYEFGEIEGLGVIEGEVKKIPSFSPNGKKHKIPHIGWNRIICKENKILDKSKNYPSMYFVHSYKAECVKKDNVIAYTKYNDLKIPAIISSNNAYGCQFHPEKSGRDGLDILKKFINL